MDESLCFFVWKRRATYKFLCLLLQCLFEKKVRENCVKLLRERERDGEVEVEVVSVFLMFL